MKSPGNFLLVDQETTKLLQILAKIHPYGNKRVLRFMLRFYIKLAKFARSRKIEPLSLIEEIAETYLAGDYAGFELKKIKRIDTEMEEVEGANVPVELRSSKPFVSDDITELKTMIRELRTTVAGGLRAGQSPETFSPTESAKLLKVKPSKGERQAQDYRKVRKQKRPRKIIF